MGRRHPEAVPQVEIVRGLGERPPVRGERQRPVALGQALLGLRAKLPEMFLTDPFCNEAEPWRTQVKGMVAYTLPRIDVQVSAVFKRVPAQARNFTIPYGAGTIFGAAKFVASNALVAPSLGRPLSGNATSVTVDLMPQTLVAAST